MIPKKILLTDLKKGAYVKNVIVNFVTFEPNGPTLTPHDVSVQLHLNSHFLCVSLLKFLLYIDTVLKKNLPYLGDCKIANDVKT